MESKTSSQVDFARIIHSVATSELEIKFKVDPDHSVHTDRDLRNRATNNAINEILAIRKKVALEILSGRNIEHNYEVFEYLNTQLKQYLGL